MTDVEKRAHDLAVALTAQKEIKDEQDAFEKYKSTYFIIYDYLKEVFTEE